MADSESDIEVVSQTRAQNKRNVKGPDSRESRSQESTQIVPSTGSDEGATAAALKGTSPEEHPPSTASVPAKKRRPKPKPKGRPQGSAPSQTQDLLDPDDDYSHFILPTNLEFSVKTQKEVKANRKAAHRQGRVPLRATPLATQLTLLHSSQLQPRPTMIVQTRAQALNLIKNEATLSKSVQRTRILAAQQAVHLHPGASRHARSRRRGKLTNYCSGFLPKFLRRWDGSCH